MGPGETISLIAVVVLLIVVLGMAYSAYERRLKFKERQLELTAASTAERAAQYATHNQQLEDRMRVLERIITDKGYDVATQIEALRDQRRVEDRDVGFDSDRRSIAARNITAN
ncbi:MAG: hypothetical protein LC648_09735 [Novosphingobium sp.]|nr:hypothetical protein [Novosphingobium sp.]